MRVRKRPPRTKAMAPSVPRTVAAVADSAPIRRLIQAESSMPWSLTSAAYQRVDQPPQMPTSREALKE